MSQPNSDTQYTAARALFEGGVPLEQMKEDFPKLIEGINRLEQEQLAETTETPKEQRGVGTPRVIRPPKPKSL